MAVAKKVRLFKIASEINIGRETIVEFLKSKGFDIENKPTSKLTEEMVNAVFDKFQREKRAAEVQREKIQKHKDIKEETRRIIREEREEKEKIEPQPAAKDTHAYKFDSSKNQIVEVEDEPEVTEEKNPPEEPEVVSGPEKEAITKEDDGIPVGTKIDLSQFGKSGKKPKPKPAPKEEPKEVKPKVEKAEKPVEEQATEPKKTPESKPEPKEIAKEPSEPKETTVEKDSKQVKKEESPKAEKEPEGFSEIPVEEAKEEVPVPEHEGEEKPEEPKEEDEAKAVDEKDPNHLKGLTVLGKIDVEKAEETERKLKGKDKKGRKTSKEKSDEEDSIEVRERNKKKKFKHREKGKTGEEEIPAEKPKVVPKPVPEKEEKRKRKRKKTIREQISEKDVDKAIRQTLSGMDSGTVSSQRMKMKMKRRAEREEKEQKIQEEREREEKVLKLAEFVTTSDLANMMGENPNDIILKCMELGKMVTINQRLEKDIIQLIAEDYGFEVEFHDEKEIDVIEDIEDKEEELKPRAPIVTIMGHVDHGKTSLLDFIRRANVVAGEAGGITQHIGAYSVELEGGKSITFLDTPGHEAFTAMRARGAQVTDIVVLIVAADDSVMPQTIEAISHAKAAEVPIVVAINKIDKPDSNPDRIKQQLADHDVLVEEWGGKYQSVEISAKFGKNVESLLESILLEAELLDLKANPDRLARGIVVESNMQKGLGPTATIIVQKGVLRVGDPFVCGANFGKVRSLLDERGKRVNEAGPADPIVVIGFDGLAEAGDNFIVMKTDVEAREVGIERRKIQREQEIRQVRHRTLDDISNQISIGGVQDLHLIIKGDVAGSVEALSDSLYKLSTEEVRVNILHKGVGAITETDVMLASASGAVIIGFNQKPTAKARVLAENEEVDIRNYAIIYDCINEIQMALEGMLTPDIKEETLGQVEIRKVFKISKIGSIAGCYVLEGKITRNDMVRVLRDGLEVYDGKISNLKREKDDVKEVKAGFECGIQLEGYNDIKEGDIIEGYKKVEVKRKLEK